MSGFEISIDSQAVDEDGDEGEEEQDAGSIRKKKQNRQTKPKSNNGKGHTKVLLSYLNDSCFTA